MLWDIICFLMIVPIAILAVLLSYVIWNHLQRKRIVDDVMINHSRDLFNGVVFPVRYSRRERFRKTWKILPWEGAGCLAIKEEGLVFIGKTLKGISVGFSLPWNACTIEWVGKKIMKNGAIDWLLVTSNQDPTKSLYITSETGIFIFGSKESTKRIFNEVNRASNTQTLRNM